MARTEAIESRSFHSRGNGPASGDVTMRLELVTDGKGPRLYGPYWYAYKKVGGRVFKVYVGKVYDERKALERLREKMGA